MSQVNFIEYDVEKLRNSFKDYIKNNYPQLKDKNVLISDAFYPLRYDIGMCFWDIFESDESIKRCQFLLEQFFHNKGRINPRSDASVYMRSIKKLREHIDNSFGGVQNMPNQSSTNMGIVEPKKITQMYTNKETENTGTAVTRPCCEEVDFYLKKWDELENYIMQENALNKLFFSTYPSNISIDEVLVKVSVLNDFYSTRIFKTYEVAKHIVDLDIDKKLHMGDVSLVDDIARVDMGSGSIITFYSFASKYCSHHFPTEYPIYDSYVEKVLKYFRKADRFSDFNNNELKVYSDFKRILKEFQVYYGLERYNLKDIDKYLWQLGKEKFPNKY